MSCPGAPSADTVQDQTAEIRARTAALHYHEQAMSTARALEPGRLIRHGWKAYSQNDEDGIIAEIFRRVGEGGRRFVEFGVQHGLESNTTYLLVTGWRGLWLEQDARFAEDIRARFAEFIAGGQLELGEAKVTPDTIDELIAPASGDEIDLLSIDVDYNDYWIWQGLSLKPRVVVIEYNATLRPPVCVTVPNEPEKSWDGTSYFGASLSALEKLGREKGYSLVGCCFSGVNAFFVRDDLTADHFAQPFTAENHYEPPRYFMRYPAGHFPGVGRYQEV